MAPRRPYSNRHPQTRKTLKSIGSFRVRLSVAVIDKNEKYRGVMHAILKACGVARSVGAEGPREALKCLRNNDIDLILTSYDLPEIDGTQLISTIRMDRHLLSRAAPIFCVTGFSEREIVEASIRAGADDFLVKPIVPSNLFSRMIHHLQHPLEYFETADYFGPDRRRIKLSGHNGPERRGEESPH